MEKTDTAKGYIQISENILGTSIQNVIAFTSDGGNRYPEIPTRQGDILLFNTAAEYMPGLLSCYKKDSHEQSDNPFCLGYEHEPGTKYIGRLCLVIRRY